MFPFIFPLTWFFFWTNIVDVCVFGPNVSLVYIYNVYTKRFFFFDSKDHRSFFWRKQQQHHIHIDCEWIDCHHTHVICFIRNLDLETHREGKNFYYFIIIINLLISMFSIQFCFQKYRLHIDDDDRLIIMIFSWFIMMNMMMN